MSLNPNQDMERLEGRLRKAKAVVVSDPLSAEKLLAQAHMLACEITERHRIDMSVPKTLDALMSWTVRREGWWDER